MHAGVTGPQQRILDALARLESLDIREPAKNTLALFAFASSRSSSYTNNLGALRTAGLISYPSAGAVALTEAGRAVANHPARPMTQAEVHEAWMALVSRPQATLLRILVARYPGRMLKADLASEAGASAASSSYTNNLGALRSLGAIDYPAPGYVVATPLLFPIGKVVPLDRSRA